MSYGLIAPCQLHYSSSLQPHPTPKRFPLESRVAAPKKTGAAPYTGAVSFFNKTNLADKQQVRYPTACTKMKYPNNKDKSRPRPEHPPTTLRSRPAGGRLRRNRCGRPDFIGSFGALAGFETPRGRSHTTVNRASDENPSACFDSEPRERGASASRAEGLANAYDPAAHPVSNSKPHRWVSPVSPLCHSSA